MTSKRPNAKDARFGVCRLCPVTVEHWHEGEARPIPSATTEEPTDA